MFGMRRIIALEGVQMTGAADIAITPLEQAFIVPGVRRMTGNAAVFPVPHQMIV